MKNEDAVRHHLGPHVEASILVPTMIRQASQKIVSQQQEISNWQRSYHEEREKREDHRLHNKRLKAENADQAAEIARLRKLIEDVLKTARGDESYAVKRVCYDIAETTLEVGQ